MSESAGKLRTDAARIVTELLGCSIHRTQTIRRGLMTFKCLVETEASERFIVRFYPRGRENIVEVEPDLLVRCHRAGMPVPVVVADARAGPRSDLKYIVYRMTEGTPLSAALHCMSAAQQTALAAELAESLFRLRRIEFHGYGELATGNTARDVSWRVFVNRSLDTGMESLEYHRLVDPSILVRLRRSAERARCVPDWHLPQLVWGDIGFSNILISATGDLAGFIDFESCLSGDPLATLGYCYCAHADQPLCTALLGAWPEALDTGAQELVLLYAILRGLRLARYAHLPLPTGHPRDPLFEVFPGLKIASDLLAEG